VNEFPEVPQVVASGSRSEWKGKQRNDGKRQANPERIAGIHQQGQSGCAVDQSYDQYPPEMRLKLSGEIDACSVLPGKHEHKQQQHTNGGKYPAQNFSMFIHFVTTLSLELAIAL
jgi:hypothetical protein